MAPPHELSLAELASPLEEPLNHPVNLRLCLKALAEDRRLSEAVLAEVLLQNMRGFFGPTLRFV